MIMLTLLAGAIPAGCVSTLPGGLDSLDAGQRAQAIVETTEAHRGGDVPRLIGLLDSDDPGTRLLAIQALERITGERFGYDYAAPEVQRREAIDRWVAWESSRREGPGSGRAGGEDRT